MTILEVYDWLSRELAGDVLYYVLVNEPYDRAQATRSTSTSHCFPPPAAQLYTFLFKRLNNFSKGVNRTFVGDYFQPWLTYLWCTWMVCVWLSLNQPQCAWSWQWGHLLPSKTMWLIDVFWSVFVQQWISVTGRRRIRLHRDNTEDELWDHVFLCLTEDSVDTVGRYDMLHLCGIRWRYAATKPLQSILVIIVVGFGLFMGLVENYTRATLLNNTLNHKGERTMEISLILSYLSVEWPTAS